METTTILSAARVPWNKGKPKPAIGMALYSVRAVLNGRGANALEMVRENFL